jgi:hypothetical protein
VSVVAQALAEPGSVTFRVSVSDGGCGKTGNQTYGQSFVYGGGSQVSFSRALGPIAPSSRGLSILATQQRWSDTL